MNTILIINAILNHEGELGFYEFIKRDLLNRNIKVSSHFLDCFRNKYFNAKIAVKSA